MYVPCILYSFFFQTIKCKNIFINNNLYNVTTLTERTRLSISSKNSTIDVINQSKYLIVMEVSLLNMLKLAHILCAWATHKRELPPSSVTQKQSNQSGLSFVSISINQSIRTAVQCCTTLYAFTCAVRSHSTSTEWYTIVEKGRNLCASYIYRNKISSHYHQQCYVWNT